jgi:glyoxylase-like metal-dependent hydrolase (beta-lactamase superfamily II)
MEIIPITTNYLFEVNSYLIKTDKGCYLIDTGMKKKRRQLENELEKAACEPRDLKLIIITHGHFDHVGNVAYLRDRYGASVAMHREDARMIESGDMFIDAKGGILTGLIGVLMKLFSLDEFERFTPDIYLEDNQDLSECGLPAIVIHTPGHSKGSISILTEEGNLFCGDLYYNAKKPEKNSLVDDRVAFENSVKKLRGLNLLMVYPGHGNPFNMEELSD